MACSIRDCVTHADRFDSVPCLIQLKMVDIMIEPTRAMIIANKRILCCYEVSTPFTEDQLSVLNGIDSTDPSVYIRELKRATRPKCGVYACTAHKMGGLTQPCRIPIQGKVFQGELVIESQSVSFKSDTETLDLYHSPQPFTREILMTLNDIESQEPYAYVKKLKIATKTAHCSFIPIRTDPLTSGGRMADVRYPWNSPIPEQSIRQDLTTEKALNRGFARLIVEKDREIEELRRKLNIEIS